MPDWKNSTDGFSSFYPSVWHIKFLLQPSPRRALSPPRRLFDDAPAHIRLPTALTPPLCTHLAEQIVGYLLFMRGQIPMPKDQLARRVGREDGRATKKAADFLTASGSLLEQRLPALFEEASGRLRTAFVLGTSVSAPKEVWLLDFLDVKATKAENAADKENEFANSDEKEDSDEEPSTPKPSRPPLHDRAKLTRAVLRQLATSLDSLDRIAPIPGKTSFFQQRTLLDSFATSSDNIIPTPFRAALLITLASIFQSFARKFINSSTNVQTPGQSPDDKDRRTRRARAG